jgi:asparagine synthase (glutamine-hydrolysing)
MCGILGAVGSYTPTESRFRTALTCLEHRGPDDSGVFISKSAKLGMTRLAIIGVATARQPAYSLDKRYVCIFNGEIYNKDSLAKYLSKNGLEIEPSNEAELIVNLYMLRGSSMMTAFEGMFAIAILDLTNDEIFLARDRYGEKPVWYSIHDKNIYFASEVKGIYAFNGYHGLSKDHVHDYLQLGFTLSPDSIFDDIKSLQPGTFLKWCNNKTSISSYYEPKKTPKKKSDFSELKKELTQLLVSSLESRIVAERDVGFFLSGGIDSSVLAALSSRHLGIQPKTFSLGFKSDPTTEIYTAASIAKLIGAEHHELVVEPTFEKVVEIIENLDHPFADSSIIPSYMLCQEARKKIVVAISGDGADEVLAGYPRYSINRFAKFLYRFGLTKGSFNFNQIVNDSFHANVNRYKNLMGWNSSRYLRWQSLIPENEVEELCGTKGTLNSKLWSSNLPFESSGFNDYVEEMQWMDLKTYLPNDILFKMDYASMAHGLEVRSPYLDSQVVEFGLGLPKKYKVRNKETKVLLRSIASDFYPPDIVRRPKHGFSIPKNLWMQSEIGFKMISLLMEEKTVTRGVFNQVAVTRILEQHAAGHDRSDAIWTLGTFEIWARAWLDPN